MSDLAPLFTDVAEVLRCETVQRLYAENKALKEELASQTRIVVARVDLREQERPRTEHIVAEGGLETIEELWLDDMPQNYVKVLEGMENGHYNSYYAIKLEKTNAWIGNLRTFSDYAFIVRLVKNDSSAILGVFAEGTENNRAGYDEGGYHQSNVVDVEPNLPHSMLELKSTNKSFALEHLCFKTVEFGNHPYWKDDRAENGLPIHEFVDSSLQKFINSAKDDEENQGAHFDLFVQGQLALNMLVNHAPENSTESVFDYLLFRQVDDNLAFLDDIE